MEIKVDDQELFWEHVESAPFQAGVDSGYWSLLCSREEPGWPVVLIGVRAGPKEGYPEQYVFRFDLAGYPQEAPTACPWDIDRDKPLEPSEWPRGRRRVPKVFNPGWRPHALYAPCDREAMKGHDQWRTAHKGLWWESTFTIVVYLQFLHQLLTSQDYLDG